MKFSEKILEAKQHERRIPELAMGFQHARDEDGEGKDQEEVVECRHKEG
jgi:hypothetical protein